MTFSYEGFDSEVVEARTIKVGDEVVVERRTTVRVVRVERDEEWTILHLADGIRMKSRLDRLMEAVV